MILSDTGSAPTPEALLGVEEQLLAELDGKACLWCGRAATGLYWACLLADCRNPGGDRPELILPAMVCATPANVALLAGWAPRFADCDPATGMITLDSVRERWTPRTRAVLFVHLYGQTADLEPLSSWCREHGATLIEDNAQALGARLPDGRPAGTLGAMAVYSFNPTKILQSGGGALLVRDQELAWRLRGLLARHHPSALLDAGRRAQLASSYRNLHHSLAALKRLLPSQDISVPFGRLRAAYDGLYLAPLKDAAALAAAWPELPAILERRREKAALYEQLLADDGPWSVLSGWRKSGVCWRFSLLLRDPERLVALSDAVRQDGFHVSNLYWELSSFFRPRDACPESDRFARRIVNLWVDDSQTLNDVRRCCESLKHHAQRR